MTILDDTGAIERLRFFNGQRLAAADMQGIEAFQREMRWLHNRSLHQPGIGNGYAITGKKGDREVTIRPGYALDVQGREIVLIRDHVEPIPPVGGDDAGGPAYFDLVVSYPAEQDLEEAETRAGLCAPRGVIRLREEPLFCWVRLRRNELTEALEVVDPRLALEVANGTRLRLARIEVENCKLKRDISTTQRRSARPSHLPRVRSGQSPVTWSDTGFSIGVQLKRFAISAEVSTSNGGFANTPAYTARIEGKRPLIIPNLPAIDTDNGFIFDGQLLVQDSAPDHFTAFLWVFAFQANMSVDLLTRVSAEWQVVWIGVEE